MSNRDNIAAIEQHIYVACSEGDYETVNMLEHQLEYLRGDVEYPFNDDPSALSVLGWQDQDKE